MNITKGATVLVQVEFRKRTPFSATLSLYDPTSPKITVYDPQGLAQVDDQALTKSAVGQYYYVVQTAATWLPGDYRTKVTCTDGAYSEADSNPSVFTLE